MKKKIIAQVIIALFVILHSWAAIQPVFANSISIATDWSWKAYSAIPPNTTEWTEVNYDDTFWWDVDAPHQHKLAPTEIKNMENTTAQWIWSTSSDGDNVFVYFRKSFWLTEQPMSAILRLTADDDYWLYVNGVFVGEDSFYFGNAPREHWRTAETYDITPLLNAGKNVIAVKVYDWGLSEGLLLDCTIEGAQLSPMNFWTSFPRWIGFLIFGGAIIFIVLAIMLIPRRISKKTLVAIITSRGQASFKGLAKELGTDEKDLQKKVRDLISKNKLKARISEDGTTVENLSEGSMNSKNL